MRDAYIFDAIRSPRGKGRADGSLNEVTPVKLSADMLNALKARNGFDGHAVEDVIWGCAQPAGEAGYNVARVTALLGEWFGWRDVLDLGDLSNARGSEAWLLLWTRLYRRLGTGNFSMKIVR